MNRNGRHPSLPHIGPFVDNKIYQNSCHLLIKANSKHKIFEIAIKFGINDHSQLDVVIPYKKRNHTCLVKFDNHDYSTV